MAWIGIGLAVMLAVLVPLALSQTAVPQAADNSGGGNVEPLGAVSAGRTPVLSSPAAAGSVHGQLDAHSQVGPRAQPMSRAQVVALVQHRYHARVVRTHLLQDANGRALYEFRLLSSAGKVWTVRIDAYSGAELP